MNWPSHQRGIDASVSNLSLSDSKIWLVYAITTVLAVLAIVSVILRFCLRRLATTHLGSDE